MKYIENNESIKIVFKMLNRHGFFVYLVGGCIRDITLNKEPYDFDFVTNATVDDIKMIFSNTYDTGVKHGTITVRINKSNFEISTVRCDNADKKTENQILKSDIMLRDFTINTVCYSPETGIVDYLEGIKDIKNKSIRGVVNPKDRFEEDPLRMLRAIRFKAQLGFNIESKTFDEIINNAHLVSKVSMERIRDEVQKMILANAECLIDLNKSNLLDKIINNTYIQLLGDDRNKSLSMMVEILKNAKGNIKICWSCFITYVFYNKLFENELINDDKVISDYVQKIKQICKTFKLDNLSVKYVIKFFNCLVFRIEIDKGSIRKAVALFGKDIFTEMINFKRLYYVSLGYDNMHLVKYNKIQLIFEEMDINEDFIFKSQLKISGNDIKQLGINEGEKIGHILNYLFDVVLCNTTLNNKKDLIRISNEYIGKF